MRQETQSVLEQPAGKIAKKIDRTPLFEKQGKAYFQSNLPNQIIQLFVSPETSAGRKRSKNHEIGILRNTISSYLFEYVEEFHISTHFVNKLSETEMTVKKTEPIPLNIKVYNLDDDSLSSRFGRINGKGLEFPVIEHFYTGSENVTWVNEYHVYSLGIATPEEFKQINRIVSKANAVIRGLCDRRQIALADIQFQFGRSNGQVVLTDELSPFTCRFLDLGAHNESRRNRFLPLQENTTDAFAELCDRLMLKV